MIDSSGCYLGAAIRLSCAEAGKRSDVSGRRRLFVRGVKPARVYWGDNALDGYWQGGFRSLVDWGQIICECVVVMVCVLGVFVYFRAGSP